MKTKLPLIVIVLVVVVMIASCGGSHSGLCGIAMGSAPLRSVANDKGVVHGYLMIGTKVSIVYRDGDYYYVRSKSSFGFTPAILIATTVSCD